MLRSGVRFLVLFGLAVCGCDRGVTEPASPPVPIASEMPPEAPRSATPVESSAPAAELPDSSESPMVAWLKRAGQGEFALSDMIDPKKGVPFAEYSEDESGENPRADKDR